MWSIEYENDVGPSDDYFIQWWNVTNGTMSFRCGTESEAEWLVDVLNEHEPYEEEEG